MSDDTIPEPTEPRRVQGLDTDELFAAVRAAADRRERQLAAYQRAVNRIDDLCEYRWRGMTTDELRDAVMARIDDLTKALKALKEIDHDE